VGETGLRNDHELTWRELGLLLLVIAAILAVGAALYLGDYNESFYSESEGVRAVFEGITQMGNDILYLVILILVFVSYDKAFARRFFYLFFIVVFATDFLKELFHDPRPPSNDLREHPASGYGLPSGHTTTAITFYGYPVLSHLDETRVKRLLLLACVTIMVLVPISRLIIGAHDLQDVIGGAVLSLTILVTFMVLQPWVSRAAATWSLGMKLTVGTIAALALWGVGGLILAARHPGDAALAFAEAGRGGGLLLGCAVAFPLEEAYIGYRPDLLSMGNRIKAALIGVPIAIGLYIVMELLVGPALPEQVENMVTYSLLMMGLVLMITSVLKRALPEVREQTT
jgi:membrane-associated phospholipid phosphatase